MALMQKVIFLFSTLIAASLISVGNAQTFYDGVIGPLSITKDGRATLAVSVENREMSLRIVYPDQADFASRVCASINASDAALKIASPS